MITKIYFVGYLSNKLQIELRNFLIIFGFKVVFTNLPPKNKYLEEIQKNMLV